MYVVHVMIQLHLAPHIPQVPVLRVQRHGELPVPPVLPSVLPLFRTVPHGHLGRAPDRLGCPADTEGEW